MKVLSLVTQGAIKMLRHELSVCFSRRFCSDVYSTTVRSDSKSVGKSDERTKSSAIKVDENKNVSNSFLRSGLDSNCDPILWYIEPCDRETGLLMATDMHVYEDFVNEAEEKILLDEIDPYMRRLRYEYDHWDNAIHGYRETERSKWSERNVVIIHRIKELAFPPEERILPLVHILDIAQNGYIKPHIDSVRFCGSIIAGLCLLSPCVMKLVNEKNPKQWAKILLQRRALYVMKGSARYDFTHEVLHEKESIFKDCVVKKDRRISLICRNEVKDDQRSP